MKTIGGCQFILNGIALDYSFVESINSMLDACDHVFVLDVGSDDGTQDVLKSMESDRLTVYLMKDRSLWDSVKGHDKLSYFQNIVMAEAEHAGMDYIFLVQADEVIHEDSIPNIRAAVEEGHDTYVMNRYNLFKDPFHMLNVVQDRKPCSSEVIRLAKAYRRSYSDGEQMEHSKVSVYKSLDAIELFHTGYVRNPKKHLVKIKHMLTEVFLREMDTRAENCEGFEWDRFFKEEDLLVIPKPLPKYLTNWVLDRYQYMAGEISPLYKGPGNISLWLAKELEEKYKKNKS